MRIRGAEELRKEVATSTIPGLNPPDGRFENPDAIFDLDEVGIEYGAVRTITQIRQSTLVRPQADIRVGTSCNDVEDGPSSMGGKDRVTVQTVLRGTPRRGHPRLFFRQAYGEAAVPALGSELSVSNATRRR